MDETVTGRISGLGAKVVLVVPSCVSPDEAHPAVGAAIMRWRWLHLLGIGKDVLMRLSR